MRGRNPTRHARWLRRQARAVMNYRSPEFVAWANWVIDITGGDLLPYRSEVAGVLLDMAEVC